MSEYKQEMTPSNTIVCYMCDEYIKKEIQAEILKRLPLKQLLQFRSVSKPWKRFIDSPYFVASYGVRHPQPHRLILRYECEVINEHKYYSFVDEPRGWYEDCSFIEFGKTCIPVPGLVSYSEGYPFVVGSSHGLLCFKKLTYNYSDANYDEMVVLWNPSIRKYIRIPVPDVPNYNIRSYQNENDDFGNYGDDDVIGFGVCPVTFNPTVLKIKRIDSKVKTKDMPGISLPWRVRVFTLSTGTWSTLSTNLPRESIRLRGSQVAINGFIYWIAFDMLDVEDARSQSQFLIMSFDLTAKEFREITLPGSLTNRLCSIQTISNLQDSLVLLEYHRDQFEKGVLMCCLWMMKRQGVNGWFTKLYNVNVPHATVKTLLGFRNTGELILVTKEKKRYNGDLEIYDPNSEAIDNCGHDGYDYSFMCSYMESLLLLDQFDGFIYSISI